MAWNAPLPGAGPEGGTVFQSEPGPAEAPAKIRTVVADDDAIAREVLRRLLKEEADIDVVGTATNGREAVDAINMLGPDLVFLDVQMPEMDGFDVLDQIEEGRMPVIIFATANEEFAVKAFEVRALDYLVKPCTRRRVQVALARARERIRQNQAGELRVKLNSLIAELRPQNKPLDRIAIKSGGRIVFLRLADLDWVEAADNYVELHAGGEKHLLRETLSVLETRLPANQFLRISRSTIVNLERIKELQPLFHGEYVVVLRNGTCLTLTRSYRGQLERFCWL